MSQEYRTEDGGTINSAQATLLGPSNSPPLRLQDGSTYHNSVQTGQTIGVRLQGGEVANVAG